jgi:peptide/nickel transport system permease protein
VLGLFYFVAIFCEFLAPYTASTRHELVFARPQRVHFVDDEGFHIRPFVYGLEAEFSMETFIWVYREDETRRYPFEFFVPGVEYRFWGLFKTNIHLFGTKEGGTILLFGTDKLGRDMFSRTLYATRISLSIGLIGVFISFILGLFLGGFAGYYGGRLDMLLSRIIEFLTSIPTVPFWMALAAALPPGWSPVVSYLAITIILSMIGWCGLARIVRGKFLELRVEEFNLAAKVAGASDFTIIIRHMIPSFLSYLIVHLTLAVPGMILGETSLSFLGLGLRPPVVSWGVLLHQAQNFSTVVLYPWLMIPGIFIIIVVLAFNFLGDGLRDAADPYK